MRASLTAYILAATLLTITPGLDTALVLRLAATQNARRAAFAGLGICMACFAWAVMVAFGLGALLAASQIAFTILRWIGAAYLVYLGIKMLRFPRRALVESSAATDAPAPGAATRSRPGTTAPSGTSYGAFATGALTNLLNPKVGLFYVSFLPQFVPQGVSVAPYILLLGAIHAGLGLVWFATLILATRPIVGILQRPHILQLLDRLTGGVFIAFGLALAVNSRKT